MVATLGVRVEVGGWENRAVLQHRLVAVPFGGAGPGTENAGTSLVLPSLSHSCPGLNGCRSKSRAAGCSSPNWGIYWKAQKICRLEICIGINHPEREAICGMERIITDPQPARKTQKRCNISRMHRDYAG